jgi:hypothetical protein
MWCSGSERARLAGWKGVVTGFAELLETARISPRRTITLLALLGMRRYPKPRVTGITLGSLGRITGFLSRRRN